MGLMRGTPEHEIERYLRTGRSDTLGAAWPGASIIERCSGADKALRQELIAEVLARSRPAVATQDIDAADLAAITRAKVEPMVRGLFPLHEQAIVLELLANSVVYLTPRNIDQVLRQEPHLHTAWNLANLYLLSCDAELLSEEAPNIIGLSQASTCYVSMRYFKGGDLFDDVVVHEAAHIFHNYKRELVGLKSTREREWLLSIAFGKRETFAYACEALSRILVLGDTKAARRDLLAKFVSEAMPSADQFDPREFVDILRQAVAARNGWKCILQRCGPPARHPASKSKPAL